MLRKTLTIVSLIGLVLSVGLWGAAYFNVWITSNRGYAINLREGCFKLLRTSDGGIIFGRDEEGGRNTESVSNEDALRLFERQFQDTHEVSVWKRVGVVVAWREWEGRTYWKPFFVVDSETGGVSYYYLPPRAALSKTFTMFVPMWMPTLFFTLIFLSAYIPLRHRRKRKKLGLCLKCGYNLKGLTEMRCPECGEAFEKQ